MDFTGKFDSELIEKHRFSYGNQKIQIESELERRNYVNENGTWFKKEDEDDYQENSGLPVFKSFLAILVVGLIVVVYFGFVSGIPEFLGKSIMGFYNSILDVRAYLPSNQAYSLSTIKGKLFLALVLFGIACFIWMALGLIKILTFKKLKISVVSVPLSILYGLSSLFSLYAEYKKRTDVSFKMIVVYLIAFFIAAAILKKVKKFWISGSLISIISTLGFVLGGNGLLSPFILLMLSGFQLIFSKGSFKSKVSKIVTNSSMF
jgi:hypothetical protein